MKKFYRHIESGEVYPEFVAPVGYQAANPKVWEEVSDVAEKPAPPAAAASVPAAIPHRLKKVKANAGPDGT